MKAAIFALVTAMSLTVSAKYVTVVLHDGGESGQEKRVVTYKVRPASAPIVESCTIVSEANSATTCDIETSTGALRDLQKFFDKVLNINGETPNPENDPANGPAGG